MPASAIAPSAPPQVVDAFRTLAKWAEKGGRLEDLAKGAIEATLGMNRERLAIFLVGAAERKVRQIAYLYERVEKMQDMLYDDESLHKASPGEIHAWLRTAQQEIQEGLDFIRKVIGADKEVDAPNNIIALLLAEQQLNVFNPGADSERVDPQAASKASRKAEGLRSLLTRLETEFKGRGIGGSGNSEPA